MEKFKDNSNRSELVMVVLCGILLLTCCLMSSYKIFSVLSIFIFSINIMYWVKINSILFVKFLAYAFMMGSAILGTIFVEFFDLYLVELECYSDFVGSLPTLIFSYWLLFVVFNFFERKKGSIVEEIVLIENKNYIMFIKCGTILSLAVYFILFCSVASSPAFILGIDRFYYSASRSNSLFISFLNNMAGNFLLFPLLAISYGNRQIRNLSYFTLVVYVAYFLWTGNKFGPFFTAMCLFYLIHYKRILTYGKKYIKRIIIIITILLLLLVGTTAFLARIFNASGSDYLLTRTAQQGQLWWKAYDTCDGEIHPADFVNEIDAIVNYKPSVTENIGSKNGIYRIMYLAAPISRVNTKLAMGSLYTEAGFASAYYYLGIVGTSMFAIVMGIIISKTLNAFVKAVNQQDIFKMLILMRLFQIERSAFSMFLFGEMFDSISIISYIILFISCKRKIILKKKNGLFIFSLVKI